MASDKYIIIVCVLYIVIAMHSMCNITVDVQIQIELTPLDICKCTQLAKQ